MLKVHAHNNQSAVTMDLLQNNELQRLFSLSSEMADVTEALLERRGAYAAEFLRGLRRSLADVKKGRVKKITSLRDLS